ncbi:LPXTG cell wall anchor domain-containing protein [Desulforamulus aeronauticus]|uniref:LPXTG cell wall anchor domain-containing protein n=1 Tax=Desulforamulus aeronauticus TaxID=53343 RepID=UPI003B75C9CF
MVDLNGKTPLGGINPNKPGGVLPKTGETSNIGYYVTGLLLLGLGLALRKRMS